MKIIFLGKKKNINETKINWKKGNYNNKKINDINCINEMIVKNTMLEKIFKKNVFTETRANCMKVPRNLVLIFLKF